MKDEVQGLVLGLFGAYAGAYLEDLTAQAEAGGLAALAEGLVNFQTPLLGLDLSNDGDWVDVLLSNLGVPSTSAAYTAAAEWANGALAGGATRGAVAAAAVDYLLNAEVEAQYADIAAAFAASVAAGVEWSEGDGANVFDVAALQEEAGLGGAFNLTNALGDLAAAQEALEAYIADFADANENDPDTPADESTVEGYLTTALANFNGDANATGTDVTAESTDAQTNAAIAIARANAAGAISDAELAVDAAQADIDAVDGLQALIDAYDAAVADQAAAQEAFEAAQTAEAGAVGSYNFNNDVVDAADVSIDIDGQIAVTALSEAADLFEVDDEGALAIIDGVTEETNPGITNLFNLIVARLEADQALQVADAAEADAWADLGANQVLWTALDTANDGLDDANDASDDLEAAIADLLAARGYADELSALEDAISNDDETGIADTIALAGYDLGADGYDSDDDDKDLIAGADDDEVEVYTAELNGGDVIAAGDFSDGDLIFVGGFTYNDGDSTEDGNNSVLEFFVEEDGNDLVVTFEDVEFGSNAAVPEVVTITLTGLSLEDVVIGDNFITLA